MHYFLVSVISLLLIGVTTSSIAEHADCMHLWYLAFKKSHFCKNTHVIMVHSMGLVTCVWITLYLSKIVLDVERCFALFLIIFNLFCKLIFLINFHSTVFVSVRFSESLVQSICYCRICRLYAYLGLEKTALLIRTSTLSWHLGKYKVPRFDLYNVRR